MSNDAVPAPIFHTQTKARRFFVDRIVQQAHAEQIKLTEDERQMLLWSESAPDSVADPELLERLAGEISDAAYESKIAGLVQRSFAADDRTSSEATHPSCARQRAQRVSCRGWNRTHTDLLGPLDFSRV